MAESVSTPSTPGLCRWLRKPQGAITSFLLHLLFTQIWLISPFLFQPFSISAPLLKERPR